ncbi:patatin-like phospholipase family protein [Rhizobium sp. L1K21]|uniref:patatin-like phospholipase family protein n=1 Tax=Rhizobium sp. L1K21 TaxID=2954933 RepID=UPI0020937727|nr:patatin-like phospholipase family protein [Rhizobium sp. L1K21]MCO6185225.1 patatin-like phospholipase family protein [Rhizobium sp. L1K21]
MEKSTQNKIAMILGDGGIKAGFIAGAADEVLREFPNFANDLDYMVGASASAGNVVYYLAMGDHHPGKEMWTTLLTDPRFMNFKGVGDLYRDQPLYDLDFMVETIFKKETPIDQSKVKHHKIQCFLPVQDSESEQIVYFTNRPVSDDTRRDLREVEKLDLYEVIKAASAAPLIFDSVVPLESKTYLDAAALDPLPIDIPEILSSKKVIILTKGKANLLKKFRYVLVSLLFLVFVFPFKRRKLSASKYIQYALKPFKLNRLIDIAINEEQAGRAVIIWPTEKIGGLLDNSSETLAKTYDHGQAAARAKFDDIKKMLLEGV